MFVSTKRRQAEQPVSEERLPVPWRLVGIWVPQIWDWENEEKQSNTCIMLVLLLLAALFFTVGKNASTNWADHKVSIDGLPRATQRFATKQRQRVQVIIFPGCTPLIINESLFSEPL
ncbi:uncharacterized protein BJX67DRAFT_34693 [Aspergillus lucknowensis]|uniref:Uncharacterized protein n=1 Tax=Aspergillus lucknowensis TaxID=176173 RepID=A0ABR4LW43_9EURO